MPRCSPAGALWCDMNSVAPETKRAAAAAGRSGGRALCRCGGDGAGRCRRAGGAAAAGRAAGGSSAGAARPARLCQCPGGRRRSGPGQRDQADPFGHGQGDRGADRRMLPPQPKRRGCWTKCSPASMRQRKSGWLARDRSLTTSTGWNCTACAAHAEMAESASHAAKASGWNRCMTALRPWPCMRRGGQISK